MSICSGVDDIIDDAFGISHIGKSSPHYRHKGSCLLLNGTPPVGFNASVLLESMLSQVEANWVVSPRRRTDDPSEKNWRWEKQTQIAEENESKEKILEKRIAQLTGGDWVNQVPTASGLFDSTSDRHRNVDLARKVGDRAFDLIELKVDSGNPLLAIAEILQYAVLYLFARLHYPIAQIASKQLLQGSVIGLRVLAPHGFYAGYALGWMVPAFNTALMSFTGGRGLPLEMNLDFLSFERSFCWPWTDEAIKRALTAITPVRWDEH